MLLFVSVQTSMSLNIFNYVPVIIYQLLRIIARIKILRIIPNLQNVAVLYKYDTKQKKWEIAKKLKTFLQ